MNGIYIRKTFCVISLLNLGREVFLKIIKRICLLYIGAAYRVYALMRWYLQLLKGGGNAIWSLKDENIGGKGERRCVVFLAIRE